MEIKNNLSKYRAWKDITQNELAANLRISSHQLRMIELNRKYPKYQTRAKICKFFNVSQNQMFYIDKN